MAKLVIKITVDKNVDPDLYDSVVNLPRRQRGAVIRRWWRQGLKLGSQTVATPQPADHPGVGYTSEPGTAIAAGHGTNGTNGKRLRQDLNGQGLLGLSAFV